MTKQEADFIGSMNMCDEISNEAYKKIMCHCEVEEQQPCETIKEIPKDYKYDTETEDFLVYRHKYTGHEIHIEKPVSRYRLEQPCEDAVSRQAVKEMLTETWTKYMPMELNINLSFVLEKISELPSVTPQTGWIPVSERLPNKYEDVSITVKIEDGGEIRYYTSMGYINSLGEWHSEEWNFPPAKVIAWMPLPLKPYRESEE